MSKDGLSFADVLILLALFLLLAALAVPRFIQAPDFGDEQDEVASETSTNATESATETNAPANP